MMQKLSIGTHQLALTLQFATGEMEGREIEVEDSDMRLEVPLDQSDMDRIETARKAVIDNEAKRIELHAPDSIKWPLNELNETLDYGELEAHVYWVRGVLVVTKTTAWFEVLVPQIGVIQSDSFEIDPACLSVA